jgi:hypothetical protein
MSGLKRVQSAAQDAVVAPTGPVAGPSMAPHTASASVLAAANALGPVDEDMGGSVSALGIPPGAAGSKEMASKV